MVKSCWHLFLISSDFFDLWYTFGLFPVVALGFILGMEFGRARAIQLGLDIKDIVDGALFIVGMGFIWSLGLRLAYHPEMLDEHGWSIMFEIWAGQSSNGGFWVLLVFIWFKKSVLALLAPR